MPYLVHRLAIANLQDMVFFFVTKAGGHGMAFPKGRQFIGVHILPDFRR
jgi:hypothetical protein